MQIRFILIFGFLCLMSNATDYPIASPKQSYSLLMREFMHGFFNYYKLPFSDAVVKCFNEKGSNTFIEFFKVSYDLGQSLINGNTTSYRYLTEAFDTLYEELTPHLMCQWETQDWKEVLHIINPGFEIPEPEAVYLNYMSKFQRLLIEGQLVEWSILITDAINELEARNFYQAGYDYAVGFAKTGKFLDSSMLEYLKFEAFDMGFLIAMGFKYEDSSIFCYNKDNVEASIEWFYHLSEAITEADLSDLKSTIEEYFKNSSIELKEHISKDVEVCLESIPGTQRFLKKFGLHPQVPIFPYALIYFSNIMPQSFYNQMTKVWENFDDWDYLNAGLEFGNFLTVVLEKYVKKPY